MLKNGTVLKSRYRIEGKLGAGGTGCVYLAIDVGIQKLWAIKQILYKKGFGAQLASHEISMMKQLDYRMFPRIVDAWSEESCCFIVSDYIDGVSLDILLKRSKIPEKTALKWGVELAGALQYLHEANPPILFLDLKPENIIVKPDGYLALIDFGIAQRIAEAGCEFGTPGYAAPEQYGTKDGELFGPQADVFAFGMTLYVMLSGQAPDPKLSIQTQKIKYDSTIKQKTKCFLLRCIHTNPKRRFQNGKELLSALEQIRENNHKIKIKLFISLLCLLLFIFLPMLQHHNERQRQYTAAEQMLKEAAEHMEDGEYTKEGIKIICGYLNSGCLNEKTEQLFLYEAAKNFFELQHNYKEAKRCFERLNEDAYPEKMFFLKLCELQTGFAQDTSDLRDCLDRFYEYNRTEGFSGKKFENELLITSCLEQLGSGPEDVRKAVRYLEAGMQELTATKGEEEFVPKLQAEYSRRLCILYERLGEHGKMHDYGALAIMLLPEGEETEKADIAERLTLSREKNRNY